VRVTARPAIARLDPYKPGRASTDADGGLASNEPPLPVPASVRAAVLQALDHLHRYPDPLATALREMLAETLRVEPEQILVSNGSDELIYLLCLAFVAPGGVVVCADPPYRLHEVIPPLVGASVTSVPLTNWVHDLPRMAEIPAEIAFICNPHNPTGTAVLGSALEAFADSAAAGLIVVDEAYIDFAEQPERHTALHLARDGKVVLVRTLSKMFGLAGARVGFLIAPPEMVDTLRRIRPPFSVNALGQAAALAAVADHTQQQRVRDHVLATRPLVEQVFQSAGYQTVPSETNFILVIAPDEEGLVNRLWDRGISVRPGSSLGLPGSVRVTIPSERGLTLLTHALSSQ
jgi:histidinol-phosphate aminotransferase